MEGLRPLSEGLTGQAAPFAPEDLFFSRTDRRGVIRSGNSVFQRMVGLPWERLIGAPHRVVRHPDMPKGVFQLFWARLEAGDPVGAYVLNRTASGDHYWVFAVAMPSPDGSGYFSYRLKPTGTRLEQVEALYGELKEAEDSGARDPEQSAAALEAWTEAEGFGGYADFMALALAEEFAARETAIDRFANAEVGRSMRMAETIRDARDHASGIATLFNGIRNVPTNIRILATQLEQNAGPVSVISTNHSSLSTEMVTGVDEFRLSTQETGTLINRSLFLTCASALLEEMAEDFARDSGLPDAVDAADERRRLQDQNARLAGQQTDALAAVSTQARRFAEVTEGLKRHVAGLDVTRIMCKIENARFRDNRTGLTEIIDNLQTVQASISEKLSTLERASVAILSSARKATQQG